MYTKRLFHKKLTFSQIIKKLSQFLYLSCSNFSKNNLWESASSCSFGFVFSFIPIFLMIFTILIRFLQVSESAFNYVLDFFKQFASIIDINSLADTVLQAHSMKAFDIFLAFWVIWMARKLFISIIQAMNRIFRSISKRGSWLNQILTFVTEFVIVILIIVVVIVAFIVNKMNSLPIFSYILKTFPEIITPGSNLVASGLFYFLLFVCTAYIYKFISGTKPRLRICLFYAALSTVAFFFLSLWLNKFLNTKNYNIIYGTISTLVILMVKVYFFFVIFLFCAQMVYVSQFFYPLLQGEIYLLPEYEDEKIGSEIRRLMFINPFLLQSPENTIDLEENEVLYTKNTPLTDVYYVCNGEIEVSYENRIEFCKKGDFLGDIECMTNQKYQGTAAATQKTEVMKISAKEFKALLHENPLAANKALLKISTEI